MSPLLAAIESFIDAIRDEDSWVEELNQHSQAIGDVLPSATQKELDDALSRLASLFPNVPLVAVGQVTITCGSLVESGGDPSLAGPALLQKLPRIAETAGEFYQRCKALAESDDELIEELRPEAAENIGDDVQPDTLSTAEILDDYISGEGWQGLARRLGPELFEDHPAAVLGFMADDFFRLGLIAHLSRSKDLRNEAKQQPELLARTLELDELASTSDSFLASMLQVLDDETIVVIHVAQRRGYEVHIGGLADNFQLHTLLAGALIGPSEDGLLAGDAPAERALAECRDAPVSDSGGESITGAFNLWNWPALQSDGQLPEEQTEHSDDWIFNEGCPADIASFEGHRIVLLGPPPYQRSWRAGRAFQGMAAELNVERILTDSEVADWIARLKVAEKP